MADLLLLQTPADSYEEKGMEQTPYWIRGALFCYKMRARIGLFGGVVQRRAVNLCVAGTQSEWGGGEGGSNRKRIHAVSYVSLRSLTWDPWRILTSHAVQWGINNLFAGPFSCHWLFISHRTRKRAKLLIHITGKHLQWCSHKSTSLGKRPAV